MDIDTALDAFYHSKHKERVNKVYEPKPEPVEQSQYELEINKEIISYLERNFLPSPLSKPATEHS